MSNTPLWIIAICVLLRTLVHGWHGFWKWYASRYQYYSSRDLRLLRVLNRVLYNRDL